MHVADMLARKWRIYSLLLCENNMFILSPKTLLIYSQMRFQTWRKLWLNLAIAEKELGLPISEQAITEMKANLVRFSYALILFTLIKLNIYHDRLLIKSNLRQQQRRRRKGGTMLWLTYTLLGLLLQLLPASFSSHFLPFYLNYCKQITSQPRSNIMLRD